MSAIEGKKTMRCWAPKLCCRQELIQKTGRRMIGMKKTDLCWASFRREEQRSLDMFSGRSSRLNRYNKVSVECLSSTTE